MSSGRIPTPAYVVDPTSRRPSAPPLTLEPIPAAAGHAGQDTFNGLVRGLGFVNDPLHSGVQFQAERIDDFEDSIEGRIALTGKGLVEAFAG